MTLEQLLTSLIALLTRSGGNRVSAADILQACQNIVNFFSSQLASIIPDWTADVTFNTNGSGAGKYCKYPDTTGKKRLYETLTDGNINHAPPASGGSNTYWQEISASASASIPEWAAGVYGPGLIIVFHNHSINGPGLYQLIDPARPYNSTNIETEITASDWKLIGVVDHDRGIYDLSTNAYPTSGGTGPGGVPAPGDEWIGGNSGSFNVQGLGTIDLYRGAILRYIGGDVSLPNSWVVKQ